MQLNVTTDYAIRIVLYTAICGQRVSSAVLADKLKIPQSVVRKLGRKLADAGMIDITSGAQGGFLLRKDPGEIALLDVIALFEPTTRINRCLEEDEYCSRFATKDCPVRCFYCGLQELMDENLKSVTIRQLIEKGPPGKNTGCSERQ